MVSVDPYGILDRAQTTSSHWLRNLGDAQDQFRKNSSSVFQNGLNNDASFQLYPSGLAAKQARNNYDTNAYNTDDSLLGDQAAAKRAAFKLFQARDTYRVRPFTFGDTPENQALRKRAADAGLLYNANAAEAQNRLLPEAERARRSTLRFGADDSDLNDTLLQDRAGYQRSLFRLGQKRNEDELNGAGANIGLDPSVTGDAVLNQLDPAMASHVKAISEGREPLPSSYAQTKPYWQNVVNTLYQYNPGYDTTIYSNRQAARKQFEANGMGAREIENLNSAIGHLGEFANLSDQLGGTSFTPANAIGNYFKRAFGSVPITAYNRQLGNESGEIAKIIKGGTPTIEEIRHARNDLSPNGSPHQRIGAITEDLHSALERAAAANQNYKNAFGVDNPNLLTPASLENINRVYHQSGRNPETDISDPYIRGMLRAAPDYSGAVGGTPYSQIARPQSQAEYDALPAGAVYLDGEGRPHTKG